MKIEIIALALIVFAIIVITLGIIKIHTYPGKIAAARKHPQTDAIEVTSLLGLLIFPFWMMALIWAYSGAVIGKLYEREPESSDNDSNAPDAQVPASTQSIDAPADNPAS